MTTLDRVTGQPAVPRPRWTGRWTSDSTYLLDMQSGAANRDLLDSLDVDALVTLEPGLDELQRTPSWKVALTTGLLARQDEAELHLQDREKLLRAHMASIARVCERFVTKLDELPQLLPVARVRRPARRAIDRLAAHSEDWATRTLSGPVPRRALAVTRVENPDIYANRMVTELVHPILTTALRRRIDHLRRLKMDLADLASSPNKGTHFRNDRLYAFWGDDFSAAAKASAYVADTIGELEALAAWANVLRSSTLAVALRGRTTGQRALRQNNVIANDRHYRSAGLVWSAYAKELAPEESAEARTERLLRRHEAFGSYVYCLLARALDQLGYRPGEDRIPQGTEPMELSGGWGRVTLGRSGQGVVILTAAGRSTRFVPLLDLVGVSDSHDDIAERWAELERDITTPTVVVFLAPAARIRSLPGPLGQAMLSAGPDPLHPSPLAGVPVSPLETTSLERLARAVAVAVNLPALLRYPEPLRMAGDRLPRRLVEYLQREGIGNPALSPLFHRPDQDSIFLRRPLTAEERANLDAVLRVLDEQTRGPGWQRDNAKAIGALGAVVNEAEERVRQLLSCPLCCTEASTADVRRSAEIFMVTCRSCAARWGHEQCALCGGRIPIIEPVQRLLNPEESGPGWVERVFGQDALASPCWARTLPTRYVCPACRHCSVSETDQVATCSRCSGEITTDPLGSGGGGAGLQ